MRNPTNGVTLTVVTITPLSAKGIWRTLMISIMRWGRTHIGLSSYWYEKLNDRFMLRKAADKKTGVMQYVIDDLNYGLFVNGQYTFLEFYDKVRLKATSADFVEYIVKMQATGNGNIKSAVYRSQITHHLKSMVESADRYEKDRAVLSHLEIRVLQYSQSFFPVSLYQKIRPALIKYNKRYKHLYHATLDLCEGRSSEREGDNRCIWGCRGYGH